MSTINDYMPFNLEHLAEQVESWVRYIPTDPERALQALDRLDAASARIRSANPLPEAVPEPRECWYWGCGLPLPEDAHPSRRYCDEDCRREAENGDRRHRRQREVLV
jgi:hypothetical protein